MAFTWTAGVCFRDKVAWSLAPRVRPHRLAWAHEIRGSCDLTCCRLARSGPDPRLSRTHESGQRQSSPSTADLDCRAHAHSVGNTRHHDLACCAGSHAGQAGPGCPNPVVRVRRGLRRCPRFSRCLLGAWHPGAIHDLAARAVIRAAFRTIRQLRDHSGHSCPAYFASCPARRSSPRLICWFARHLLGGVTRRKLRAISPVAVPDLPVDPRSFPHGPKSKARRENRVGARRRRPIALGCVTRGDRARCARDLLSLRVPFATLGARGSLRRRLMFWCWFCLGEDQGARRADTCGLGGCRFRWF